MSAPMQLATQLESSIGALNDPVAPNPDPAFVRIEDLDGTAFADGELLEYLASLPEQTKAAFSLRRRDLALSPLSLAQSRLWLFDQVHAGSYLHNVPLAIRVRGALDHDLLLGSLHMLVDRHASLRTRFPLEAGGPVMVADLSPKIPCPHLDLRMHDAATREQHAYRTILDLVRQPFDLARGPLFRPLHVQLAADDHILVLCMHHIVTDGWSVNLLWNDLQMIYGALAEATPVAPRMQAIEYADFALFQREQLNAEGLQAGLAFWTQALAGYDGLLELPRDKPRLGRTQARGARVLHHLSPALSDAVRAYSRAQGVTYFFTTLAAFLVFLRHLAQKTDVAVATPVSGRSLPEVEDVVGFFVNLVVLRHQVEDGLSFAALAGSVRGMVLDAFSHQEVPFEAVVAALNPRREEGVRPLAEVSFGTWQDAVRQSTTIGGMSTEPYDIDIGAADGSLNVMVGETGSTLTLFVEYDSDCFLPETIRRWLHHYTTILERAIADDRQTVGHLALLTEGEQRDMLERFSRGTAIAAPVTFMHTLFEQHAALAPEAPALIAADTGELGPTVLSYGSLNRCANRLAHRLVAAGVSPEDRIAVLFEDSMLAVVSFLAILKAGAAYLPLDPAYPQERLQYLVSDARPVLVLTHEPAAGGLAPSAVPVWHLSLADLLRESEAEPGQQNLKPAQLGLSPASAAYIIYTSGSTGRPKGVINHHAGLANLAQVQPVLFDVGPRSRILQFASVGFDASIWEMSMALAAGASFYLKAHKRLLAGDTLAETMAHHGITHVTLPPSALSVLRDSPAYAQTVFIVAGEKFPAALAERWAARARIFNAYGPTETTVCASVSPCIAAHGEAVPIGTPFPNCRMYLLDATQQQVPVGVTGEIYIGGSGVARGYAGRPALTAAAFLPDPFSDLPGARMYRTGDLARWLPNGQSVYIGRRDFQVKVRGHRIEPSEIDGVLMKHPRIAEAVTLAEEDTVGGSRLITFLVARAARDVDHGEMREYLRSRLPSYMVPAFLHTVAAIPKNTSGKVDRAALFAMRPAGGASTGDDAAPHTAIERTVAAIWKSILKVPRVRLDDNLFDLGGHSLLAVQIRDELVRQTRGQIEVLDLFAFPTVRSFAQHLTSRNNPPDRAADMHLRSQQRRKYLNARAQRTTS